MGHAFKECPGPFVTEDAFPSSDRNGCPSRWGAVEVGAPVYGKKSSCSPLLLRSKFLAVRGGGVGSTKHPFFSSFYVGSGLNAASPHASSTPFSLLPSFVEDGPMNVEEV